MNNQPYEEYTLRAENLFSKYDADKDDYIEINELKNLLDDTAKEIGIPYPNDEDVEKVMLDTDKNKDNKISREEFIKLYMILCLIKSESVK